MKTKETILIKTEINNTKKWTKDVDQIYVQEKSISKARKYYQEIEPIPVRQNMNDSNSKMKKI